MELHQLRLFQALAQTGSFSRAARACHISQPALWVHIRQLEAELEIALVDRLPRGVQLTEAGEMVLEYTRRMFATTEDLHSALADLKGLKRGKLVIGASTTPGIYILPEALGSFKRKHPQIELDLHIGNTHQVEDSVLNREVILGIIGQEPHNEDLSFNFYLTDRLVAIVSPVHRFANRKTISLQNLAEEPFLAREAGSNTRDTYEAAFRENGVTVQIAMELGSTEAIKRGVIANLGVSIVSPHTIQWETQRRQLVALRLRDPGFQRQFNIICHRRRKLPVAAAAFQAFLLGKKVH